jgi:hypothetical protein
MEYKRSPAQPEGTASEILTDQILTDQILTDQILTDQILIRLELPHQQFDTHGSRC